MEMKTDTGIKNIREKTMQGTVHHNSRQAACTLSEDQTGLKPYEMRVYIGTQGANILHIKKGTEEIVVHRNNVDIHVPNDPEQRSVGMKSQGTEVDDGTLLQS